MARIAIVGAGPAGSSAGYRLAARGHAVTLFDRAAFPREKTCGDWLTPSALRELAALGLDDAVLARGAPGHATIRSTTLVSPDGRRSTHASRSHGSCIERRILDAIVFEHATGAGCRFERRSFTELKRDDPLLAKFDHVIDARGAAVANPNAIGLRGYWSVPRDALAPEADQEIAIATDDAFRRGYGWVFPVSADATTVRFNIGVGLWKDDSRRGRSVADYLARFVEEHPLALQIERAATARTRPAGFPVALGTWNNPVAADGMLRIGDAAALADPLTGDGIGNALASARIAADAIDHTGSGNEALANWQRTFDTTLAPELRRAFLLRQLLVSTTAKNLATRMLALPHLRARLHDAVFGETGYRDLFRRRSNASD